jgi:hypothetical protein
MLYAPTVEGALAKDFQQRTPMPVQIILIMRAWISLTAAEPGLKIE